MTGSPRIILLGATGQVGQEMLHILHHAGHPASHLYALASRTSAGKKIAYGQETLIIEELDTFSFDRGDLVFSALPSHVAGKILPKLTPSDLTIIDKSAFFRNNSDVPLVVPEVNGHLLDKKSSLICTPNCVVIPLVMVLSPLHQHYPIQSLVLSTYQAVSGAGQKGLDDLQHQIATSSAPQYFPRPIAFNVIPQIGLFEHDGTTEEELKIIQETRKILGEATLPMAVTCTRVPVIIGHAISLTITFKNPPPPLEKIQQLLCAVQGMKVSAPQSPENYVTPRESAHQDDVFVSRLRTQQDMNSTSLWITCDNIRKGAALNAYHIGKQLYPSLS